MSAAYAITLARGKTLLLGDGKPMLLDIPDEDYYEWRDVDEDERVRVFELFRAFREMMVARNLQAGSMAAAACRIHLGRGWSAKNLRELFWAYRFGGHKPGDWRKLGAMYPAGDWRILLRNYTGKNQVLPKEFAQWMAEQWAQFRGRGDCFSACYRHIIQELWLKGSPIPGYGTIDDWCRRTGRARPNPLLIRPGELPESWTESNLRRYLPKRKATRKQISNGYLDAHQYQPDQVLTDRSQLMPLQFVYIDDSRPDFKCLHFAGGRGDIVYPLLVLGLDAATGVDVANCAKPRALKSPEAEDALERKTRHGVTQDMALLVVLNALRNFGLPPWPITFVHENAAGCVPVEARRMIESMFGERVRFEQTGVFKSKMMDYGFAETGGAPYDKAPIEAFWRILMTQLARTKGSTGPRYDTQPPELKEIERYTLSLLERAGNLGSIVARLDKPFLEFPEAHAAIEDALRLLRFRAKHSLQGFDRVREWRRSPAHGYEPIETFLALPEAEQIAVAAQKDGLIDRLECPAERFSRLLKGAEFTAVDPDLLTYLEGPRRKVTIRAGKITLESDAHTDDRMIFRETNHPLLEEEYEGRVFDAAISREGDRVVLSDEGRILGSVARQDRVSRADKDALQAEQRRVHNARVADRQALAGYYLPSTNEALLQLRAHNDAVIAQAKAEIEAPAPKVSAPRLTAAEKIARANRSAQMASAAKAQLSEPGLDQI